MAILYIDNLSWWLVFSVIVQSSVLVDIYLRVMCLMPVVSSPSSFMRCLQLYAGEQVLWQRQVLCYIVYLSIAQSTSIGGC